jgi:predicted ester cyclase
MSIGEHKQLISGLVDEVWNQHHAEAIDRYFGPGLREEVLEHYQQLLGGFPDLQVTIEDDLIAEGDMVVARLTLRGTHTGPFAGRDASGRLVRWSSIRIYRMADHQVVQTWAMQDRLGLLQQLGALPELELVNWAGGRRAGDRSGRS